MMSRRATLAFHLFALASILCAVFIIALRYPARVEIMAAALFGFVAGIAFDRWLLRPAVDWRMRQIRA